MKYRLLPENACYILYLYVTAGVQWGLLHQNETELNLAIGKVYLHNYASGFTLGAKDTRTLTLLVSDCR